MKISKLIVPVVALTVISSNNKVAASCESICSEGFHRCIDLCTANSFFPLACYTGCGIGYTACMGVCAALR